MPSLIDIRRRIRSVKNTQQITKAMKMVSAAKLRKAQDRIIEARPYAGMLTQVLANIAAASAGNDQLLELPLLATREEKRIQLILVTADRGLAGAFNTNLNKAAQSFLQDHPSQQVEIEAVGRKGREYFTRRHVPLSGDWTGLSNKPTYADAAKIAQKVIDRYTNAEIDSVYLIYNEFRSIVSQRITVKKVLPVPLPQDAEQMDYLFEEPPLQLLGSLLPKYVESMVYTAILESTTSEHAARMTAMDAASSNAADVIEKLTLYMNRVRQASITKEIIEVVSGAAALE
jgi:F-type H+-transporting ATPase subunit gamma